MGMYRIPRLDFGSQLVATLFAIERMRADIGTGTTPREMYVELHRLFDVVMSVISARIEGNHTTIYEALDRVGSTEPASTDEQLREIANISAAMRFIDELDPSAQLTHALVRDLHARTVDGLTREGDPTPGAYRREEVGIAGSRHKPPSWVTIHADMSALLDFANAERPLHEQMLQVAIAHHRFVWLHPFRHGNGRVSRLFTYAMLRRTVFATRGYSALNPLAVFGNDRHSYITALEQADDLSEKGTIAWVDFFASGIRSDLERLLSLQNFRFVADELVSPALDMLLRDGFVSAEEREALGEVLQRDIAKAGDLEAQLPGSASQRSRKIRSLRPQPADAGRRRPANVSTFACSRTACTASHPPTRRGRLPAENAF